MSKNKKIFITLICIVLVVVYGKCLMARGKYLLDREGMEIINTVYYPDKKYKAIVYFFSGGGATVANDVRVAVIPSYKESAYDSDVKFLLYRASQSSVEISWKSNDNILISYSGDIGDVIKEEKKVDNINILYDDIKKIWSID